MQKGTALFAACLQNRAGLSTAGKSPFLFNRFSVKQMLSLSWSVKSNSHLLSIIWRSARNVYLSFYNILQSLSSAKLSIVISLNRGLLIQNHDSIFGLYSSHSTKPSCRLLFPHEQAHRISNEDISQDFLSPLLQHQS